MYLDGLEVVADHVAGLRLNSDRYVVMSMPFLMKPTWPSTNEAFMPPVCGAGRRAGVAERAVGRLGAVHEPLRLVVDPEELVAAHACRGTSSGCV